MSKIVENGLLIEEEACKYNTRVKCYRTPNGERVPYEIMVADRLVFIDGGYDESEASIFNRLNHGEYYDAMDELNGVGYKQHYVSEPLSKDELLDKSRARARRKIFDYCICNEFDCFITLTLSPEQIDRNDYAAVIKKLNTFLANRVRRNELKYVGVPELHTNGGLHFHFAATADSFKLSDSGTVSVTGRKKPIKVSTADRLKIPQDERHTVYNIDDWELGFSTCIKTYGERGALAAYLCKELTKDCQKRIAADGSIDKIGGRWYLHGGKLNLPSVEIFNSNFNEYDNISYSVDCDGGNFKVIKLTEQGDVLK